MIDFKTERFRKIAYAFLETIITSDLTTEEASKAYVFSMNILVRIEQDSETVPQTKKCRQPPRMETSGIKKKERNNVKKV